MLLLDIINKIGDLIKKFYISYRKSCDYIFPITRPRHLAVSSSGILEQLSLINHYLFQILNIAHMKEGGLTDWKEYYLQFLQELLFWGLHFDIFPLY